MTTPTKINVIVIGAGVSGLTTALRLAEAKFSVRVIAKEPPSRTTSAAAGANWGPYLSDDERLLHWSEQTRVVLTSIANTEPEAGVFLVRGMEAETFAVDTPAWAPGLPDFAVCDPTELPSGYVVGWWFTAPVIDMPRYLDYLERRLAGYGTEVELEAVSSLADLTAQADIVVNCAGLGARELAADTTLHPIRGQLVVAENPGVDYFFQDHSDEDPVTYFMPQGGQIILGGCAAAGSENLEYDPEEEARIIERCARIEPRLREPRVLGHRVGLRPSRPAVRLEAEWMGERPVIHNYGHGGSGITMSWGCADAVVDQARAVVATGVPGPRPAAESADLSTMDS